MKKLGMFIATGYEEVEMLAVIDLARRAGIECDIISVTGEAVVESSHKVRLVADQLFEEVDPGTYDALVIPGGIPGTPNLGAHEGVCRALRQAAEDGRLVAAICAAPTVLGKLGLLEGKPATCYPGMEDELLGAAKLTDKVVKCGNIITSRGMGTAIDFGLAIVEYLTGSPEDTKALAKKIVYLDA